MAVHDAITFEKRFSVMEGGLAFLGVVDYHHVEIQKGDVLLGGCLHDADAPVDIGRITELLVVGCGDGEVGAGIEGLMTDEHAVAERLPSEVLGGRETTGMKEMTGSVDDVRVAVEHGGVITEGRFFCVS